MIGILAKLSSFPERRVGGRLTRGDVTCSTGAQQRRVERSQPGRIEGRQIDRTRDALGDLFRQGFRSPVR